MSLGELLSSGGVALPRPASGDDGFSAVFALDGSAIVRVTGAAEAVAAGAAERLERFGDRLRAGRDALEALRAALDALVAALALAAAVLAAVAGGIGPASLLRFAAVSGAYAALIPLRGPLTRLVLRGLMRAALARAMG